MLEETELWFWLQLAKSKEEVSHKIRTSKKFGLGFFLPLFVNTNMQNSQKEIIAMEPIAGETERESGQYAEQLQETPRRIAGRTAPWGSESSYSLTDN